MRASKPDALAWDPAAEDGDLAADPARAFSLLGSALDAYARYVHLYSPAGEGEELHRTQRKFLPAVIGYVIAILTGLVLPVAAVALYFGLAVYLVVPFREAARVLIRRHSSRQ